MSPRPLAQGDLDWVLALNRVHERELSPLTRDRLAELAEAAFRAFVADPEAGFLLTFDQDAPYDSPNFLWFRERYDRFVYIDRIAIDAAHRRQGHAEALYAAFFAAARAEGHKVAVCEVNSHPPNPGSDRFHAALGFDVVGEAELAGRGKTVRYYALDLMEPVSERA
ncbi:MAG: GNAT family N-acetyltransferase [Pseudomonadota bacterium]